MSAVYCLPFAVSCFPNPMKDYAEPLPYLIDELKHLPGIGQKSAQRIAFHLEPPRAKTHSAWRGHPRRQR